MIRKKFLHFCRRFEPRLGSSDFRRRHCRQQAARADGVHRAMMQMLLGPEEVHIVCRYQPHAQFVAEALSLAQRLSVAR